VLVPAWVAAALCIGCASAFAQPGPGSFSFGVFGDIPYSRHERQAAAAIVREMGEQGLEFAIHLGDIKSGAEPCTDDLLAWTRTLFESSRHPLIYVPGDNEWTDCHRRSNGSRDPEERLARLRDVFLRDDRSLGQRTITLARQSEDPRFRDYRENVRWQQSGVLFVGLHVVGSNDNFGRSPAADAEHGRRSVANSAWIKQSFELAARTLASAVVVVIHANPLFELPETEKARRGYNEFLRQLQAETIAFGKPVLLVHGDTHMYRVDQPMMDHKRGRPVPNFRRLETFGSPFLGWVKVTIDPARPELFVFDPYRYQAPVREATD
jgi:hypothetical protein